MKTMTCTQLNGPCALPLHGEGADAIIKAQDAHLNDAIAHGNPTHHDATQAMSNRWKHPIAEMSWYRKVKKDYAALPGDFPIT